MSRALLRACGLGPRGLARTLTSQAITVMPDGSLVVTTFFRLSWPLENGDTSNKHAGLSTARFERPGLPSPGPTSLGGLRHVGDGDSCFIRR
jgi:hypothetical protein